MLHLVLTSKWFEKVKSGEKRIEYRSMTPYWTKRILNVRHKYRHVVFHKGYTSTTLTFVITKIDVGECPYDGWDGEYIRINFK